MAIQKKDMIWFSADCSVLLRKLTVKLHMVLSIIININTEQLDTTTRMIPDERPSLHTKSSQHVRVPLEVRFDDKQIWYVNQLK
jgi:hypothetical protein